MKRIFDPSFRYTPSYGTDLRKSFERIRREQTTRNAKTVPSLEAAGAGGVLELRRLTGGPPQRVF